MRIGLICWVWAAVWVPGWGESPIERQRAAMERQREGIESQRDRVEAQRPAITQQRESVRAQVPEARKPVAAFFTTPWTTEAVESMGGETAAAASCDPVERAEMEAMIRANAEKSGITPEVLRALIRQESAFYPCAVSNKGAMGLMQLMPGTAAELRVIDPFDPQENVRAGTQYLKQLLDRYEGDLVLALSAYNAGPARVDASGGVPAIKETRDYVNRILGDAR